MSPAEPLATALRYRMDKLILGERDHSLITLSSDDRRRHLYVIGQTGTGKSTFLENLALQDIYEGRAVIFIDPHGSSALHIADRIPPDRINDTIYFDPLSDNVVTFNPLSYTGSPLRRSTIAQQFVSSIKDVYSQFFTLPYWGSQSERVLTNAIRLLLDTPHSTLVDLPQLFNDVSYRTKLIHNSLDKHIKDYWTLEYGTLKKKEQDNLTSPVRNIVGQFATDPILRDIFGHPSTFDPLEVMREKILLCNFSKAMGEQSMRLLGALLISVFFQQAMERNSPEPFYLYIDEFQNFATDVLASILSEARKFGLSLTLANQFLKQVPDPVREAVFGNVGSMAVFRVGPFDAPLLAEQLDMDAKGLTMTANHHLWVPKGEAVLIDALPPTASLGSLPAVLAHTRSRHSRLRG